MDFLDEWEAMSFDGKVKRLAVMREGTEFPMGPITHAFWARKNSKRQNEKVVLILNARM